MQHCCVVTCSLSPDARYASRIHVAALHGTATQRNAPHLNAAGVNCQWTIFHYIIRVGHVYELRIRPSRGPSDLILTNNQKCEGLEARLIPNQHFMILVRPYARNHWPRPRFRPRDTVVSAQRFKLALASIDSGVWTVTVIIRFRLSSELNVDDTACSTASAPSSTRTTMADGHRFSAERRLRRRLMAQS